MGILNWITQGCDSLTTTAAPSIDALGLHICIALATIMLVWFGVQESLASAQGGPGFVPSWYRVRLRRRLLLVVSGSW